MSDVPDLLDRRARLSPEQLARLAQRVRAAQGGQPARHAIARGPDNGPMPASLAQQGQWFLWQMNPQDTAYHVGGGLGLHGSLDVAALQGALAALVERHEVLRTVFRPARQGRGIEQVILPAAPVDLPCVDLAALPPDERQARRHAEVQRACGAPFDLQAGPLLRGVLLKIAPHEHELLLVMHHIISDAWSVDLLLQDLTQGYAAGVQGRPAVLPLPPIRHADFTQWQWQWLESADCARQLAWWRAQLGDTHPVLELPADHPRGTGGARAAAQHALDLPAGLVKAVREQSRQRGGTLFMALAAAWHILLFRLTGQDDIRSGVPVANRNRPETAGVVGFFINTFVLRTRIEAHMRIEEVLQHVRDAAIAAQAHQELPLERLVEALRPARTAGGGTALFQVLFNHLQHDERSLAQWPGLQVRKIDFGVRTAPFDLTLETVEQPDGGVQAQFRYAGALWEPDTIARLAAQYQAVLAALAEQPQQAVQDIGLLDAAEQARLQHWGRPGPRQAPGPALHALIEQQAHRRPQATALVCGDAALTYGELNLRANRLAHRLISLGVAPEARVGIALERSVEMVVAVLAVLKAGGAYVPLDPDYPTGRLAHMVQDAGIGLLLTHGSLQARLPTGTAQVLLLDTLDLQAGPGGDPQVAVHEDHLAYVIYTSGSTGQPKGAQLCHRNVTRLLAATQPWFGFGPDDVWTMFHSYAFDFSVWEIFGALCTGGTLVIVPFWVSRSPQDFLQLLRRHRVTVLNQTPSAWGQLQAEPQALEGPLALRLVIFGGEALEPERLRPWIEHRGDAQPQLVNMYGITETTVHVTYRPVTRADLGAPRSPVGQAIPDLGLHVLDEALNHVPIGVAGELYVAGEGLARGYLGQPGLTARRFVADPFDAHGGRLYRTGDRVRWTRQGELEYLGRIDHQVKVRGFRIELGEIEAQLRAQPGVREAVVVARDGLGGPRLVAYVAAQAGPGVDRATLREQLGQVLPEPMVPAAIMVLDALPLNANGKVDRGALPEPEFGSGRVAEPPRGEVEEELARLWAEALGVASVAIGRGDNFFEIGGHSLLLLQVHRGLAGRFDVQPSIVDLFKYPTLESLAAFIASGARPGALAQAGRRPGTFLPLKRPSPSDRAPT